jgi:hypothetical protein
LFGGGKAVLGDFAEFSLIIANYLNSNNILDLTASDVLTGLDMVRRLRRQQTLEARGRVILETATINVELTEVRHDDGVVDLEAAPVPKPKELEDKESSLVISADSDPRQNRKREVLSARDRNDVYLMAESAHFVVFAHAAYTWVSFVLEHPITGFCSLSYCNLKQCAGCFCFTINQKIKGDHRSSMALPHYRSGADFRPSLDDIVYATYYDTVDKIPYFIALDHQWKTIVLAIRGTLTLESVVADINCVPHELTEIGIECGFDGNGSYCHAGMFRSGKWVYKDLSR